MLLYEPFWAKNDTWIRANYKPLHRYGHFHVRTWLAVIEILIHAFLLHWKYKKNVMDQITYTREISIKLEPVLWHVSHNITNKASNSVLPYSMYIKRNFCQMPLKKLSIFSYITELVKLVYAVMLEHRNTSFDYLISRNINLSDMLHWLLFKITSTLTYAQFCASQQRICCLSGNLVISPYAVRALHDSLQVYRTAQSRKTLNCSYRCNGW